MNNKNLDALYWLDGNAEVLQFRQPSTSLVPKVSDKSVKSDKEPSERVSEERFCTIVQSDILRKIRIIANREGLQIKEVVNAAFEKAIKSYERRNGPVDGRMKGDAKNLF